VYRSRSRPEPINLAGADKKGPAPAEVYLLHKKIIFTVTLLKCKIEAFSKTPTLLLLISHIESDVNHF